ncbi:hypothetical protein SAMN04487950_2346 [Halogranum rubrum]|uniref:Uncharacterized protein n=1 Tax=Halogranum rubrum TaxID=553466 RepID=A0A1I4EUP0_9EURY|nr:hypothetical protein [Halogranum rubrum]SFL08247.1 hypothetical protein SAMN04487950_2346 [Halogranum rubrum]
MRSTDRAVSETLSFVFVFALITMSIGTVYVVGYGGLQDVRDNERITNAERAFDVLADNLQDIYRDGAPGRATELKLADANLRFGTETRMNVSVNNLDGTSSWDSNDISLTPLVYQAGDETALVYEGGMVLRVDPSRTTVKNRVGMVFTEDADVRTAVIPLVQTRSSGERTSVSGSTTVLVRSERSITDVMATRTNPTSETVIGDSRYAVSFEITTDPARAPAWERYLESQIPASWDDDGTDDVCVVSDGTVTCSIAVDQLYVTATRIDMSIE